MQSTHVPKEPDPSPNGGNTTTRREQGADRTCRERLGLRELTEYADISERTLRSWIYATVDPLPAAKVSILTHTCSGIGSNRWQKSTLMLSYAV